MSTLVDREETTGWWRRQGVVSDSGADLERLHFYPAQDAAEAFQPPGVPGDGGFVLNQLRDIPRSVERRTAEQLGHDERTARAYYWGTVRGLDQDARTIEEVMGIKAEMEQILEWIQPKARR